MYILVGRFQTFTLGHVKAYEYAKSKINEEVVIGLMVRLSGKMDCDNPFSVKEREKVIQAALPNARIVHLNTAWIEHIQEVVKDENITLVIGKDREEAMNKMKVKTLVVPRTDKDISATAVRTALRQDKYEDFCQQMPLAVHGMYEELREAINGFDTK